MSKSNVYSSMFGYGQDESRETADTEQQRIRMSTQITAGFCGTYAVGTYKLTIIPKIPELESRNDDDNVEQIDDISYKSSFDGKPMLLSYGDR